MQGLDPFVTQAAGGGPLLYLLQRAAFSLLDRLFHAAPTAQCVSIWLGGGAEHRRQGHLEGLIIDAVLAQDG